MDLPRGRGPLSTRVRRLLGEGERSVAELCAPPSHDVDVLADEDFQLALWMLYELHYRGFDGCGELEWDPGVVAVRRSLEARFEDELRRRTASFVECALEHSDDVVAQIEYLVELVDGPNLAGYLQREATREQFLDFLTQRSLYHLKESDPQSFVLPRVEGRVKAALAELQYDEYGGGRPERLHATLFGDALEACGLDRRYGAYVDVVPAHTLAVSNVMSLFALQRRLRGAALGHLAAFEMTSSLPCRRIAAGLERVGLPQRAAAYFHEHVEADSVHEQIALRDICGALVEEEPALRRDVLLGVASCRYLDQVVATSLLDGWTAESADQPVGVAVKS
jgi:pyrroloquinoline quinone (PQQ) biosynthesis protein C